MVEPVKKCVVYGVSLWFVLEVEGFFKAEQNDRCHGIYLEPNVKKKKHNVVFIF